MRLREGDQPLRRCEVATKRSADYKVHALIHPREMDIGASAFLQMPPEIGAQRRHQREQFGQQYVAFEKIDDAVASRLRKTDRDLAPAPLGMERRTPTCSRRGNDGLANFGIEALPRQRASHAVSNER